MLVHHRSSYGVTELGVTHIFLWSFFNGFLQNLDSPCLTFTALAIVVAFVDPTHVCST